MGTGVTTSTAISFRLNGAAIDVRGPASHTTLLDFLRARGLTGAKEGCAEGECGACAVAVVRPYREGSAYKAVNSCLIPLAAAADHEIYTVESFARNGALHPAQAAMAAAGGSQCGYCTPGFVVSLFSEFYRPARQGHCEVSALGGNLCRCTGYRPIRDAAASLGPAPDDDFARRLARPAPVLGRAESPGFTRPTSLSEAIDILANHPSARPIAGGTDLMVESNLKGKRFGKLVSLEAIPELRGFRNDPREIEIGGALTLAEIGDLWTDAPPVIATWLELFASPLIRNRATLGGNLATASPIGDSAPLLLALGAELIIAGARGNRTISLKEFFTGYRRTALAREELIVSVRIPKPLPLVIAFYKVAKRRLDDISTVAAAIAVNLRANREIELARVAYGGVAAVPLRALSVETALLGQVLREQTFRHAATHLATSLTPLSDHRGSAAYRLAMAQSLLRKFAAETSL